MSTLRKQKKKSKLKPKLSRRKEIRKLTAEINEIKKKQSINSQVDSLKRSIKLRSLGRLRKKRERKSTLLLLVPQEGDITLDPKVTKRIIKEYYMQPCANKLDNLNEIDSLKHTICQNSYKEKYTITISLCLSVFRLLKQNTLQWIIYK